MLQRAALAALLGTVLVGPAFGQVNLHWKFKDGDKFYLEEKVTSETTVTFLGQKSAEKNTKHRISHFTVKNVMADGISMEQRIESWKSQTVGGLPGGLEDGGKLLEQGCKDIVFKVKMTRTGTITKFEGYDQLLKKISALNPEEAEHFKVITSEDVLRSPLTLAFDLLPDKAVAKGDKWRKTNEISIATLGKFTFTTEFAYDGKVKEGELILGKGTFAFQPGKGNLGMGVKLLKMELRKSEHNSRIIFDADMGRLVVKETTMPLAGTLTLETQGQQTEVQMDGTESRTIRLHAKRPPEQ
jgi:Family of unknown function (DUF6263)